MLQCLMDMQAPQMMHDFAVTDQYVIFLDHALVIQPKAMLKEKTLPIWYSPRLLSPSYLLIA